MQGWPAEQAGIGHQAVVVKDDADTIGIVLWQHLLGAPCFRVVFCFKTILPDSEEHPLASSRTVPKVVFRWIRAYTTHKEKSEVFLSYQHSDQIMALGLARGLDSRGRRV